MKSKILRYTILTTLIIFIFILFLRNDNKSEMTYLLYGEHDDYEIKNGYVFKSKDLVTINLGTLEYYLELDNVESCVLSIYVDLGENKKHIFNKAMINNSSLSVKPSNNSFIGIRKEKFGEDEFAEFINNLYVTLKYTDVNNMSYETTIKLNLKKVVSL